MKRIVAAILVLFLLLFVACSSGNSEEFYHVFARINSNAPITEGVARVERYDGVYSVIEIGTRGSVLGANIYEEFEFNKWTRIHCSGYWGETFEVYVTNEKGKSLDLQHLKPTPTETPEGTRRTESYKIVGFEWGVTREYVKGYTLGIPINEEGQWDERPQVEYSGKLAGYDCEVAYGFENECLIDCSYSFYIEHMSASQIQSTADNIRSFLVRELGNPDSESSGQNEETWYLENDTIYFDADDTFIWVSFYS